MQERTRLCRAAYSNASGFSGSVTDTTVVEMCSGKASIWSIVATDVKRRDDSFFIFSKRMWVEPSVANHE
ncbi:hypothetical protein TNCV_1488601 [Trichonephila clavipes]|nr:hypothetical protein TNCV_1488601 [Trichonephila clavipes]